MEEASSEDAEDGGPKILEVSSISTVLECKRIVDKVLPTA
jgi:hypothetical protein